MLLKNINQYSLKKSFKKNTKLLKESFFFDITQLSFLLTTTLMGTNEFNLTIPSLGSLKLMFIFSRNTNLFLSLVLDAYSLTTTTRCVVYNLVYPYVDLKLNVLITNNLKFGFLYSFSTIWTSLIWVERECSEFSGVYFIGLRDSRRLLLDYSISKQVIQSIGVYDNFNEVFTEAVYSS